MLLVAGGALVVVNAWQRVVDTDAIEREAFGGRVAIETVGRLLSAGEPAITELHLKNELGIGMGGVLTVADLHGLPGRRLGPAPPGQWVEREAARVSLRLFPAGRWDRGGGGAGAHLCGWAPDGCVEVRAGREPALRGGRRRGVLPGGGRAGLAHDGGIAVERRLRRVPSVETVVSLRTTMAAACSPGGRGGADASPTGGTSA